MRSILQVPNPILNEVSEPILNVDGYIRELAQEMEYWLSGPYTIGLAAPQLGEKMRLIGAVRSPDVYPSDIVFLINPVITRHGKLGVPKLEGCLSIDYGKKFYLVPRHYSIRVVGLNLNMEPASYSPLGLFNRILQHEIDHLDGITINQIGQLHGIFIEEVDV